MLLYHVTSRLGMGLFQIWGMIMAVLKEMRRLQMARPVMSLVTLVTPEMQPNFHAPLGPYQAKLRVLVIKLSLDSNFYMIFKTTSSHIKRSVEK